MSTHKLVPVEIIERFPEINPSNYGHDDVCALNAWAVEVVLAAAAAPAVRGEPVIVDAVDEILDRTWHGPWHASVGIPVQFNLPESHPMEVLHEDGDRTKGWTSQSWSWEIEDGIAKNANIVAWRFYDKTKFDNSIIAAKQPAEQQHAPAVAVLVEVAAAALGEIQEAYNSAYPVCCGRPGNECCGSPDPEWDEVDRRMMNRLGPHHKALNDAIAAHRSQGGGGMSKARIQPLDELEMFELLQAAYPEKFPGDDDETWDAAQNFADEISGWEDVAELLGRVVMLTMPMESGLTKRISHCLGRVTVRDGQAHMIAAVRREAIEEPSRDKQ